MNRRVGSFAMASILIASSVTLMLSRAWHTTLESTAEHPMVFWSVALVLCLVLMTAALYLAVQPGSFDHPVRAIAALTALIGGATVPAYLAVYAYESRPDRARAELREILLDMDGRLYPDE